MRLCIQDPSYEKSMYLHESLLTACENGISGGGAYAFATPGGIELLLADKSFKELMNNGVFYLVIGMDDITNTDALRTLKAYEEEYEGHLIVKAYVHNTNGSTFHPKFSWFQNANGGVLIIGSGNLTQNGLRRNREAFSIVDCDSISFESIIDEWNAWIEHSQPFLFDIDNALVLSVAANNTRKRKAIFRVEQEYKEQNAFQDTAALREVFKTQPKNLGKKTRENGKKSIAPQIIESQEIDTTLSDNDEYDEDAAYWTINSNSEILVAEIPKSGNRWKQVNFSKDVFENYFGATCGENGAYRVLLKSINQSGILGNTEVRPSVSVSSHNYRFELDAATGIDYPRGGKRPIGVFAKVSERDFLYELVMPEDTGYNSLINTISERQPMSARMRRLTYPCLSISQRTPELAIWKRIVEDNP